MSKWSWKIKEMKVLGKGRTNVETQSKPRSNKWKQITRAQTKTAKGYITRMKSFSQPGFLGVKSSWWTISPAVTSQGKTSSKTRADMANPPRKRLWKSIKSDFHSKKASKTAMALLLLPSLSSEYTQNSEQSSESDIKKRGKRRIQEQL